ncbi:MAG TPA: tetratricopeptide repeat protein [Candidatus Acidoferrum sp.]|jgi:tetratricopeptide (TPR) repeat protein
MLFSVPAAAASTSARPGQDSFEATARAAASARDAGQTDQAIASYRRAVELNPDWQEGWFYLGTLEYDRDHFAEAIPAFRKLTELAPAGGPAWIFLGLCEFETNDYAAARAHLEKGVKLGTGGDPELDQVSKYHLALLLIRDGEFDRATALLASAFSGADFPAQAKTALGLALLHAPVLPSELNPSREGLVRDAGEAAAAMQSKDWDAAADRLAALVKSNPDAPFLRTAYSKSLGEAGKAREADSQLSAELAAEKSLPSDKTLRLDKLRSIYSTGSSAAASASDDTAKTSAERDAAGDPETLWNSAMADYSAARYAPAVASLKTWIETRPAEKKTKDGTAWAVMGLSEFELKDYDNALIHLQRGQELGLGGSAEAVRLARYRLGLLLIRDSQFDAASRVLSPEADSGALANEIRFALGLGLLHVAKLPEEVAAPQRSFFDRSGEVAILLRASKYDAAFPKLQQLIRESPAAPFLHYAYATGLASLSQYDEATAQLREEMRISPRSELPYVLLASIALRKRDTESALAPATRAVELAPRSAKTHYVLGRAYLELGQEEKAVTELEAANRINPASPEVHFSLAKAYAKSKQSDKAAREREEFVRLNALAEKDRGATGNPSSGAAETATPD